MSPVRALAVLSVAALLLSCDASDPSGSSDPSGTATGAPQAVEPNATVEYIVDGDTVDVVIGGDVERVRLIGIDTPETKRPDTDIECYGPEATAFIEALLPVGAAVRIERDTVNRDDFGRLLAYVYRAADGIFVNYELVRQGYAQPLTIEPNTSHAALFVDASRSAERDDLGLWSACSN